MKHIHSTFDEAGVVAFKTELNEREAFKAMFSFGLPLAELDPKEVSNIDKAVENAEAFAAEVIAMLRAARETAEAAEVRGS